MPRRALIRFVLAAAALVAAAAIWQTRTYEIDQPTAAARATRLFTAYRQGSGDPAVHFLGMRTAAYDDGWEFRWSYRPCADEAELRIFIAKSGAARYAQIPECNPQHGAMVRPRQV